MADYVKKILSLPESLKQANLNKDFVIEFYCDNPISPNTIPNKLLQKLKKSSNGSLANEEILEVLYCLLAFRPFDQEMAIEILVDRVIKRQDSSLEMIFLAVKTLSFIMCPREFLDVVVDGQDHDLLGVLSKSLDNPFASRAFATIVIVAENEENANWIQRRLLGPIKGQAMVGALIENLGHPLDSVRFWTLTSLIRIHPKIEAFKEMLDAEQLDVNLQTYRDRVKHVTNLSLDSPIVVNLNDEIKKGVFRFLLAQLTINFKLMWEPTKVSLQSFDQAENLATYWNAWLDMFKVANFKSAAKSDKESETSG